MLGRRSLAIAVVVGLVVAGCGSSETPPPSVACTSEPADVARALARAPADVRLADGTPLSECVRRAESDAELQNLGLVLTQIAEDLEASAASAPRAALQLGYLIGAARRGAPSESSIQAELVHRLERSAAITLSTEAERALAEGMRAGERSG